MPSRFAFRGERLAFTPASSRWRSSRSRSWPRSAVGSRRSSRCTPSACSRRSRCPRPGWSATGGATASAGWRRSIAINGVGAAATAIVARHLRGREVRPRRVAGGHRHPRAGRDDAADPSTVRAPAVEIAVRTELVVGPPRRDQRVIVPIADVTRDVVHALTFARTMSDDVTAVHVTDDPEDAARLREDSSGRCRASRWWSSSRRIARWSARWSVPRGAAGRPPDDVVDRAAAGVRGQEPVGADPVQRHGRRIRATLLLGDRTSSSRMSRTARGA